MSTVVPLFKLWTLALHSSSMSFKLITFTTQSNIISALKSAILSVTLYDIENGNGNRIENEGDDLNNKSKNAVVSTEYQGAMSVHPTPHTTLTTNLVQKYRNDLISALSACISILPLDRLMFTAAKRLWHEMEDFPSYSRYIQVHHTHTHNLARAHASRHTYFRYF